MSSMVIGVFVLLCLLMANIPWFSERWLGFVPLPANRSKQFVHCLLEWFFLYIIAGFLALGFEKQMMGDIYIQGWEFYTVTFCLFIVFAVPGFLYRYAIRRVTQ